MRIGGVIRFSDTLYRNVEECLNRGYDRWQFSNLLKDKPKVTP